MQKYTSSSRTHYHLVIKQHGAIHVPSLCHRSMCIPSSCILSHFLIFSDDYSVWVAGKLEPISGDYRHKAGYPMDRSPIHRRANTEAIIHTHFHTSGKFRVDNKPNPHVFPINRFLFPRTFQEHYFLITGTFCVGSFGCPMGFPGNFAL